MLVHGREDGSLQMNAVPDRDHDLLNREERLGRGLWLRSSGLLGKGRSGEQN